ncbi:phosphate acyltransferase PlsX [Holzapfeliella sp. JNUCC 72]
MKRIAVDVMGGDQGPKAVIDGVLMAREELSDFTFVLYGNQDQMKAHLPENMKQIEIVHTTEEILGEDEPVKSIRQKKDASMVLAAKSVKAGENDALLSLGNTGALLASGIFIVGRIKGIERPALMPVLPVENSDKGLTLLDAGANASCKSKHMVQWAEMGSFYSHSIRHVENPRVALLNNGSEFDKGDELHQEVYQLLKYQPNINFVGNIEGNEVLQGKADVIVADGFSGNVMLKTLEGTASTIMGVLKDSLLNNGLKVKMGAGLAKPAFKEIGKQFDMAIYGGAVLMGAKAPVIKVHGRGDGRSIYYAFHQVDEMLKQDLVQQVKEAFDKK